MKSKFKKSTTAGICATLGVFGSGIGVSFYAAKQVGSACLTALQSFTGFVSGNLTIPSYPVNVTAVLPNLTSPIEVLGRSFNITIPGGQEINFISNTPSISIPLSELAGKSIVNSIQELPEQMASYCYSNTLQTGLVYTAVATSLLALLTYTYSSNAALRDQLSLKKQLESGEQADSKLLDNADSIPLGPMPGPLANV